ncbi:hypothetical protein Bca101_053484 [Brassica carinata]
MMNGGALTRFAFSVATFLLLTVVRSQETCSKTCIAQDCKSIGIRYGKYCGIGYSGCRGEPPCDNLDACCMTHDNCVDLKGKIFEPPVPGKGPVVEVNLTRGGADTKGGLGTNVDIKTKDGSKGKLGVISWPGHFTSTGRIGHRSQEEVRIWVLEDDEKQDWSEYAYTLPGDKLREVECDVLKVDVAGVTDTGEIVLMKPEHYNSGTFYVFYFHPERNVIKRVEVQGGDHGDVYAFVDHVDDLTFDMKSWQLDVVDNYYRPDLKKAALARLSVISKGLRVAKSGPKRRNRQAWIEESAP